MNDKDIINYSKRAAAIASDRIAMKLMEKGAILIGEDNKQLPPIPPNDPHIPKPNSPHPYDKMAEEMKKRFSHCQEEIDIFFKTEKLRNQQEIDNPSIIGEAHTRSLQWAYFWEGIKKLEIERHNQQIKLKKSKKKEKKGKKNNGPRKGFNGPTYYTHQ